MMKERAGSLLWKIFLSVFAIILLIVIVLCVLETQDYPSVGAMTFFPLLGLVIFFVLAMIGVKMEYFLEKYEKILLIAFFILYTLTMAKFTLHSRGIPVHDQASVIRGAQYMAGLREDANWEYFARWPNNTMAMVLLSLVFRVAKLIHMEDGYYLALILNYIQVLAVLFCIYRLGKRYSKHGIVAAWMGMGLMSVFLPVWGHTQSLYTDALSFSYGIVAFSLWLYNYEKRRIGVKNWVFNLAAGIIWGIGFEIKVTAVISLVALLLYLLLFEKWKVFLKNLLMLAAPVLLIGVFSSMYMKTLPSKEFYDTWAVPAVGSFIGLGLDGDGGFSMDSEYFLGVTAIRGMEEKKKFSNAYILEHLDQFWNLEHMVAKVRVNFASGVMRADDFYSDAENYGFLYNCISYGGLYKYEYRTIITSYWYMLLEWIVIACVLRSMKKMNGTKQEDPAVFVPIVTVFGITLYVMLSEASNRLFYNNISMIFCAANMGIWFLWDKVEAIIKISGKSG